MLSLSFLMGGEVADGAHEAVMRVERSNIQKHYVKSEVPVKHKECVLTLKLRVFC